MADNTDVDLDSIIDRLLEVRGSRPGKQVQLLETEIRYLCTKAREIFISQPILLELEAPIKVRGGRGCLSTTADGARYAETSTGNTTSSSDCLSTVASRQKPTTCSSVTTSTVASSRWRQSACCWPTRSSPRRTFSSCEATTSARPSTASTAFTTSASDVTTSSYGRRSRT